MTQGNETTATVQVNNRREVIGTFPEHSLYLYSDVRVPGHPEWKIDSTASRTGRATIKVALGAILHANTKKDREIQEAIDGMSDGEHATITFALEGSAPRRKPRKGRSSY